MGDILAISVLYLALATAAASQVKAAHVVTVSTSLGRHLIFSNKEVPAPSGLPSIYIAKVEKLDISSIRYEKGNTVWLHFAVFFKTPATGTKVSIAFVPTIATTPRPKLTTETSVASGASFARGSVEVKQQTLGEQSYRVEASIRGQAVGSGSIAFQKAR